MGDVLPGGLPLPAPVSKQTIAMAGLLVDVYGIDELAPSASHISCLWLHNPREKTKEDMGDIAHRTVGAWNARVASGLDQERGLVALAYDQRNHGSRMVDQAANQAWRQGNETHAQDMCGIISGTVLDQSSLMDAVGGYLFLTGPRRVIDQHVALGVSLGGHSVWQTMFTEPRLVAGAIIVGCPDMMHLLSDRARLSKRGTFSAADNGASFLGSKDFPPALVEATKKFDPKALVFGTSPVADEPADRPRAKQILNGRIRGKRFLLCSGADDKLVPYRCTQPFAQWLVTAAKAWDVEGIFSVENNVYPGVGHQFSPGMITDSIRFITDAVASASSGSEVKGAKI
ncbi:hypothetical protein GQ53DRAFT_112756 [Thozetella sp. PMI_491]|nr:hypothetical protein GQ53DRAFT_112756 [Thozetella sp. PMI_491]